MKTYVVFSSEYELEMEIEGEITEEETKILADRAFSSMDIEAIHNLSWKITKIYKK